MVKATNVQIHDIDGTLMRAFRDLVDPRGEVLEIHLAEYL
jgi:hypothetical protein